MRSIYCYSNFKGKETDLGRLRNSLKVTELVLGGASRQRQVCEAFGTALNSVSSELGGSKGTDIVTMVLFEFSHFV